MRTLLRWLSLVFRFSFQSFIYDCLLWQYVSRTSLSLSALCESLANWLSYKGAVTWAYSYNFSSNFYTCKTELVLSNLYTVWSIIIFEMALVNNATYCSICWIKNQFWVSNEIWNQDLCTSRNILFINTLKNHQFSFLC